MKHFRKHPEFPVSESLSIPKFVLSWPMPSLVDQYHLASIDSVGNCRFAGYTAYADLYKADIKYTNQPSSQTVLTKALRITSDDAQWRKEALYDMTSAICQKQLALVQESEYISTCWPACITVQGVVLSAIASPYYENGNILTYAPHCSDKERLELIFQVAKALALIHSKGDVHGSISPENVCIGDDGKVRMTDIGLNLLLRQADSQNLSTIPSSWMYKPGEELESGMCTIEAEIYTFASIIYSIYINKPPFQVSSRRHPFKGLHQICHVGHAKLFEKPTKMTDGLWKIVQRSWVQDPALRPSMSDIVDELQKLVEQV